MITDSETNFLYLADSLPIKQHEFYKRFENVLNDCKIDFKLIPNTKDIWAVDYMPIQISRDKFLQFKYNPDYLIPKKWLKTISDVDSICELMGIKNQKSDIIVDGGNVVRTTDKVILCDKVFHENKSISEKELIKQLKDLFEVDKLIFVPWEKHDFTGHADGMVRFIDSNTVLINDYSNEDLKFQRSFRMSLQNAGLDWTELPYNPYENKSDDEANGIYINYLQMQQGIIMPTFGMKEDEVAFKLLEEIFKGQNILTIESNEVAKEGGILNCITWNIKQ